MLTQRNGRGDTWGAFLRRLVRATVEAAEETRADSWRIIIVSFALAIIIVALLRT